MNQPPIQSLMLKKEQSSYQLSDEDVILKYKVTSDNYYVGILFNRYSSLIFGICLKYMKNRHDAEDLMVEVYEKLTLVLIKKDVEKFRNWLHIMVKNHCVSKLRSLQTQHKRVEAYKEYVKLINIHVDEENDQRGGNAVDDVVLRENISKLPEMQRICIDYFYLQEKSYKDISEILQVEVGKIRSYIQNGRRNLKIMLSKEK